MATPVPSSSDIARVRRLAAEPTNTTYDDATITEYIERYPLRDAENNTPDETDWAGKWDVYAAAGDIWEEKAAAYVGGFDFSADGASFSRSQVYEQMLGQARRCRAYSSAVSSSIKIFPINETGYSTTDSSYIGNLSEDDYDR